MTDVPRVSILIPCYNTRRWIGAAIESALAQTWPNKELIVVDDGSTDGSLDVIRSFGDRVRWETGSNRGGSAARNRLLELSSGEWLQYLDADDYLLPDKIASQLAHATTSPPADLLYSPISMEYWQDDTAVRREEQPLPEPHDPWILLARWEFPGTHAVLFRRTAVLTCGGWKPDQPCCQERELYLRMFKAGKRFVFCPQGGAIYRHWNNLTVSKSNPLLNIVKRLELIDAEEEHLLATGQMTPPRKDALAHARLECARSIYAFDRQLARQVARSAIARHRRFRLPAAACFPARYRLAFRLFGFSAAERLASAFRSVRPTASVERG